MTLITNGHNIHITTARGIIPIQTWPVFVPSPLYCVTVEKNQHLDLQNLCLSISGLEPQFSKRSNYPLQLHRGIIQITR